jgi:hypothetical protein
MNFKRGPRCQKVWSTCQVTIPETFTCDDFDKAQARVSGLVRLASLQMATLTSVSATWLLY